MRFILGLVICAATSFAGEIPPDKLPLNIALSNSPPTASISIKKTGAAMDGGSIINDLLFSDGRLYRVVLDTPIDLVSGKVVYPSLHFTIFVPGQWEDREVLEHGSAAERRLIELLESLIKISKDNRERKNAKSLVNCLMFREQPFPRARGGRWDLTPH